MSEQINKLCGLNLPANFTDRASAACRRFSTNFVSETNVAPQTLKTNNDICMHLFLTLDIVMCLSDYRWGLDWDLDLLDPYRS
jgi:hypothetical protein